MPKDPKHCTLAELRPYAQEYARRLRIGKAARPKSLQPCSGCGRDLGARERRLPCPSCGARNRA